MCQLVLSFCTWSTNMLTVLCYLRCANKNRFWKVTFSRSFHKYWGRSTRMFSMLTDTPWNLLYYGSHRTFRKWTKLENKHHPFQMWGIFRGQKDTNVFPVKSCHELSELLNYGQLRINNKWESYNNTCFQEQKQCSLSTSQSIGAALTPRKKQIGGGKSCDSHQ